MREVFLLVVIYFIDHVWSVFVQLSLWGGYLEHGVHASIVARV